MAAILVGGGDCWTQFWKGFTQGPFHQSLVQIGPVVLEEKLMTDGRPMVAIADMTLRLRWAKKPEQIRSDSFLTSY
jgi:hypothetical protein